LRKILAADILTTTPLFGGGFALRGPNLQDVTIRYNVVG